MIPPPNYPAFFEWCLRNPVEQALVVSPQRYPWEPGRLHASDLGATLPAEDGGCMRRPWLRIHGHPTRQHTAGEALMLFKAHLIHDLLADWLEKRLHVKYPEWRVLAVEEALPDMEGGVGRLDVRLQHALSGETHTLDFKSVRGSAFEFRSFPYDSHLLQVAAYARAKGDEQFVILYTDREGSNYMVQTGPHPRMDDQVLAGWAALTALKGQPEPPPVVPPKAVLAKRKTTGPAVTLELPFQCNYCKCRDISCQAALPADLRGKVVGHVDSATGAFLPAPGREALVPLAEAALAVALVKRDGELPAEPDEAEAGQTAGGGQGGVETTDETKGEGE
jgi:hypothetical protein